MYYTAMPVTLLEPKKDKPWESEYVQDPDFNMNSKVKKQDFRQISFDSRSMSLNEESNKKTKPKTMKLTTKKLKELIKEEVQKIKKKTILENKEKEIKFQLRLLKESYEEETVSVCDDCGMGIVKQHGSHDIGDGWGVCDECGSIEGPTTEMTWDEKEKLDDGEITLSDIKSSKA